MRACLIVVTLLALPVSWMQGEEAPRAAEAEQPTSDTAPAASEDPFITKMRESLDDPSVSEEQKALIHAGIEEIERQNRERAVQREAEAEFEPGVLNADIHQRINATFADEVAKLRNAVTSGDDLALRYAARRYSSEPEQFLKMKGSEQLLAKEREAARVPDGRDIFDLLAAKESFGPVNSSSELVERAQVEALKCVRPESSYSVDLGGGYLAMSALADTKKGARARIDGKLTRITPDSEGMALLTQKVVAEHVGEYVAPFSMIGRAHAYISKEAFRNDETWRREYEKLFMAPDFVYRAMLSPAFTDFGCGAAECAPGVFSVVCVIPKIDTSGTLKRTPYPSLYNDNPPLGWKKPR